MTASEFRFDEPESRAAFVCRRVRDGHPILQVAHEADGDWQFLCGGDHSGESGDKPVVVCLRDAVALDPTVNELADMCRLHEASRQTADSPWVIHDEMEDVVRDNVREYGWHAMKVAGDAEGPPFVYTIGLWKTYGHPELICIGLPPDVTHDVLWQCAHHIRAGGKLEDGQRFDEAFENAACELRSMDLKYYSEYLGYALWFYDGSDFPVLQLFWPDRNGVLPFDEGCLQSVIDKQPVLSGE